jgi:hypothetical protein
MLDTNDTGRRLDLTDAQQVRERLIDRAYAVYLEARKQGIVAGMIREAIYYRIGIVFELMPTEIKGDLTTRGTGQPEHIGFFWQML